ncbi:conserved hypothetical protein [Aspergillus fumigatus A1163]|uniref:Uncharacterized protein n=1 Tax=Aspergillus fumigatus (strain CBS 144.89 / FGSC A1163 / CEA10) TaxID=451804 RepID=B0Y2K3_ASPFC|nr:conserved hypothetical protein [Aspergillus fumigatus A1163]
MNEAHLHLGDSGDQLGDWVLPESPGQDCHYRGVGIAGIRVMCHLMPQAQLSCRSSFISMIRCFT